MCQIKGQRKRAYTIRKFLSFASEKIGGEMFQSDRRTLDLPDQR